MPPVTEGTKASADALRKSLGDGILKLDPDQLRSLAQQLQSKSEDLSGLKGGVTDAAQSASGEAQQFISTYKPAAIYEGLLTSLTSVSTKYAEEISKVSARLEKDASALQWIAEHHEEAQKMAVSKTDAVDTDIGADGGKGGKGGNGGSETSPNSPRTVSTAYGQWDDDEWFDHDNGYTPPTETPGAAGPSSPAGGGMPIYKL